MSVWISEKDYRHGDGAAVGITLNVPFLQEIKQDFEFRQLLNKVYRQLHADEPVSPRIAAELLASLRDELETYFALEEFYGYFERSPETNPSVTQQARQLRTEHESLYLQFNQLVDASEQIVYHECSPDVTVQQISEQLDQFCAALAEHEQNEMELMMRMCNEDIGVGD